ncbi:hypothetical protein NFI96_022340 [Prochilodus magdalenae]|nr:hypothetical protein NFI96_022340 [Prochilodus magdalenae]
MGESAIHEEPDVNLKHATAFVLSAREKHCLSQSAVNDIVAGVQHYQASLLDSLKNQMARVFQRHSEVTDQLLSELIILKTHLPKFALHICKTQLSRSCLG